MVRNTILMLATAGTLVLLFVGYWLLTYVPTQRPADERVLAELPQAQPVADEEVLRIEGPELAAHVTSGEQMTLTLFEPGTGRATDRIRYRNIRKVPGSDNDIQLAEPEWTRLLPGGMVATVTAERAQFSVERVESQTLRPRYGWFEGGVRLLIDRNAGAGAVPADERPADLVTVEMDRLDFDLELGELKTRGAIRINGREFELSGAGLALLWNQADNRIERLDMPAGGELAFDPRGRWLTGLAPPADDGVQRSGVARPPPAVSGPAGDPKRGPTSRRPQTSGAYVCTLSGGVTVDQQRGDQRQGGLTADGLSLLFDLARTEPAGPVASQPSDTATADQAAATGPAAATADRERVLVRWEGALAMRPAAPAAGGSRRRTVSATGKTVRLMAGERTIECGELVYDSPDERLWLRPDARGFVELTDPRLRVRTAAAYVDRKRGIVKLVGPVELEQAGSPDETMRIACDLWAELRLSEARSDADAAAPDVFTEGELESALFVGDVRVRIGPQRLAAQRLETFFRPPQANEPLKARLQRAVAAGDVRLSGGDDDGEPAAWSVLRAHVSHAASYIIGRRAAAAPRPQALTCEWLDLGFVAGEDGRVQPRDVSAIGEVDLADPRRQVAARGERLRAALAAGNQLERATIVGSERQPALLHAYPYTVRGRQIELDEPAGTLHVDGRSRLSFPATRSLQGEQRRRAVPVVVTADQTLHIDGRAEPESLLSAVNLVGNVLARSGDERLRAETMTLLLEEVTVPRPPPGPLAGVQQFLRDLRRQGRPGDQAAGSAGVSPAELAGLGTSQAGRRVRREPVKLLAHNALAERERRVAGDPQPLILQNLSAPEMEVDIRARRIRTLGETILLMVNRQLEPASPADAEAIGLPSALMSSGPSQTALRCERSMLYVLGEDGPQRRDTVFFESGVLFRHVTGREIVKLEELLPDLARDPQRLSQLKTRNTGLQCDRLEAMFTFAEPRADRYGQQRSAPRLTWLNATGNAHLRDQQETLSREVYAHQLEFDRAGGFVRVLGLPQPKIDARIYQEDARTGRYSTPAVGPEIVIDLKTNAVRTGPLAGEIAR